MSTPAPSSSGSVVRCTSRVPRSNRGSSLFLLLILAVVVATVLGGIFSYISTSAKSEKRSNVRMESTYAAEYAFERAFDHLNTLIATNNAPDISLTTGATNLKTAPSDVFGSSDGYSWSAFLTVPMEKGVPANSFTNFNASAGQYKYLTVVEFSRTVPGMQNKVHMQFQREWDYTLTPLFQYAIFYDRDMELFPGADFVVGGKVHSNGTIYTGTGASILFKDDVSYVNRYAPNELSPNDPHSPGMGGPLTIATQKFVTTFKNPPGKSSANIGDTNPNNDGPRELVEVPDIHSTDPLGEERMYNKAGLKILVNSNPSGGDTLIAGTGHTLAPGEMVFLTRDGTVIPSTDPLGKYLASLVTVSGSISDYREGTTATAPASLATTNIDVSKLTTAYNNGVLQTSIPTQWPNVAALPSSIKKQSSAIGLQGKQFWNGTVYVSDIANTASHRTAVKIFNGQTLPDGSAPNGSSSQAGLTIATDNAAYIIGDFNTGSGTIPVNDSSAADTADNFASGYTVQPAAVMADAVTILSSNWTSSNYDAQPTLSKRIAAFTTVNTALISGIVESVKDGPNKAYSGGVENYLRLLEDWGKAGGSKRLTYYGSIVNLYNSQQSTKKWISTGTYYEAPKRNWNFDLQFLNPTRLPPGTPVLRSLQRGQWSQIDDRS